MKKIILFLLLVLIIPETFSCAQETDKPASKVNLGAGIGLDYGGIGGRVSFMTSQRFELFGAIGYNLLGLGFNGGLDFRLMPAKRICPFIGAMYGYNSVIKVEGASQYNKVYYGPSFPIGLQFWNAKRTSFLNIELVVPIRSSSFHDDYNNLKNSQSITFKNDILPVAFSLGFHINI